MQKRFPKGDITILKGNATHWTGPDNISLIQVMGKYNADDDNNNDDYFVAFFNFH